MGEAGEFIGPGGARVGGGGRCFEAAGNCFGEDGAAGEGRWPTLAKAVAGVAVARSSFTPFTMLDKAPLPEYPFTQAALWQRCLEMSPTAHRDAAELAKRGISAAMLTKFDADTAAFGEMDPDEVLLQEGKMVTEEKDATQVALETAIQAVMDCVGLKDDPRTAGYKRFGVTSVNSLSQAKLHLAATMVAKQGRKYLADYADKGLTAALLTTVEQEDAAFVDQMADRHEAVSTRAGATRARLLFANGLYRQLVALANAGQAAWRLTDAQKAHEYVIDPGVVRATPRAATGP